MSKKSSRKAISKSLRFEVFKRDGFVCMYCGAHPPQSILHVDHINPVANGGDNSIDNLITSCSACNLGKSDRVLSDVPVSLEQKAAEIREREEQINGYMDVVNAKKQRIQQAAEEVCQVYETFVPGYTLSERSMVTVRMFVDELGFDVVHSAMEVACTSPRVRRNNEFKYFCGICWNRIKEKNNVN